MRKPIAPQSDVKPDAEPDAAPFARPASAWRRAGRALAIAVAGLPCLAVGLLALLGRWLPWADTAANLAPLALAAGVVLVAVWVLAARGRRWLGAFLGLTVALNVLAAGPDLSGAVLDQAGRPRPADSDLKILTFNTWDLSPDRKASVDVILNSGADVVTLQEGVGMLRQQMPALLARYPYHATCATWWGCEIVILSKRPLRRLAWSVGEPDRGGAPFTLVSVAATAPDGQPFTLISTHLGHPWRGALRSRQAAALSHLAAVSHPESLVVTGDFNANGATEVMRRQDGLLRPLTRRTRAAPTWPAWLEGVPTPVPFPLFGIDQVYAGPEWRTVSMTRLPHGGSDHYPLLVRLSRSHP